MGIDQVEMVDVVMDTGSAWFTLTTIDCTDCTAETYDYTASPYTYSELADSAIEVYYFQNGIDIYGVQSLDWVCITSEVDTCATDHTWVNIQNYAVNVSGLIGFNYDPAAMEWAGLSPAVHYLDSLYDQDIIADKIFGVAL